MCVCTWLISVLDVCLCELYLDARARMCVCLQFRCACVSVVDMCRLSLYVLDVRVFVLVSGVCVC